MPKLCTFPRVNLIFDRQPRISRMFSYLFRRLNRQNHCFCYFRILKYFAAGQLTAADHKEAPPPAIQPPTHTLHPLSSALQLQVLPFSLASTIYTSLNSTAAWSFPTSPPHHHILATTKCSWLKASTACPLPYHFKQQLTPHRCLPAADHKETPPPVSSPTTHNLNTLFSLISTSCQSPQRNTASCSLSNLSSLHRICTSTKCPIQTKRRRLPTPATATPFLPTSPPNHNPLAALTSCPSRRSVIHCPVAHSSTISST